MNIDFHQDDSLSDNDINILVSANKLSPKVMDLLEQLNKLNEEFTDSQMLPVSTNDRIVMVAFDDIVGIEVYGNQLTIYDLNATYETTGKLKDIFHKLSPYHFIQISRSAIINLDHLKSMETAFSGSMTAFLTNGLKLNVSRKYLPGLKRSLKL
ncbi:LytTR family transcriptional regulator [Apilactobacillus micheneri]|uniref:LytTR family transcriptional regulator n=1 Tax=Apilactobacillus micheneri TaxID=1899430 RepID=A0A9Q8INY0_9LACO|nr:LytTR family DNA-binding domain-containing protein [Apilactobacillus micheneri]TPR39855.1 LytTR family transcriptional regulator [Apilactobacillus micheneri]TPR43776.1 LytTR family transcriptional regulator [Apilactobacillus micheneri]TPR45329.1 LytTR family transcriptional regulator [Apilactobacillus micheneri]